MWFYESRWVEDREIRGKEAKIVEIKKKKMISVKKRWWMGVQARGMWTYMWVLKLSFVNERRLLVQPKSKMWNVCHGTSHVFNTDSGPTHLIKLNLLFKTFLLNGEQFPFSNPLHAFFFPLFLKKQILKIYMIWQIISYAFYGFFFFKLYKPIKLEVFMDRVGFKYDNDIFYVCLSLTWIKIWI